jgi:hypothetical protein
MNTTLKINNKVVESFSKIISNQFLDQDHIFVKDLKLKGDSKDRSVFMKAGFTQSFAPIVSKSEFVPNKMAIHLMKHKKRLALGIKYEYGDRITNMEGALHTFVTPIINFAMTGDYIYQYGHGATSFQGKARNMVMSAAIQPDFEYDNVMLPIVKVTDKEVTGESIDWEKFELIHEMKEIKKETLSEYEEKLRKHMIYHLTENHKLPSLNSIKGSMNTKDCIDYLNNIISNKEDFEIKDQYTNMQGHVISLEALFNVYVEQIRNEFSVFESNLPQGYVYTINPPRIFASEIGQKNVAILNRLQMLAFRQLGIKSFKNLRGIGFDGFADPEGVSLYKTIFKGVEVEIKEKNLLLGTDGKYSSKHGYALIVHNNSDAFGENM